MERPVIVAPQPDYDRKVDLAQRHYYARVASHAIQLLDFSPGVSSADPEWYENILTAANPPTDTEIIDIEGVLSITPKDRLVDLIFELGCRLAAPGFGVVVEDDGAAKTNFLMQLNLSKKRQTEFFKAAGEQSALIRNQLRTLHLVPFKMI